MPSDCNSNYAFLYHHALVPHPRPQTWGMSHSLNVLATDSLALSVIPSFWWLQWPSRWCSNTKATSSFFFLTESEWARERTWAGREADSSLSRKPDTGSVLGLQGHDLSLRQTLNWLSHLGAPSSWILTNMLKSERLMLFFNSIYSHLGAARCYLEHILAPPYFGFALNPQLIPLYFYP